LATPSPHSHLNFAAAGALKGSVITKLLHTRYRVEDLEKTVAFYRDVLGLKEVRRHTSGRGSQLVFFKAPGSDEEIELCKFDQSGPVKVGPDLTHLAFEVENMDEFARQAAAKGYPLSDGPHRTQSGDSIAFIDAPEGYEIELIERGRK
jgi:lactoylglutathione lyase